MERWQSDRETRERSRRAVGWMLAGLAVVLVAAMVPLPAAATHLQATCGGYWSAPGEDCLFDHVRNPVWFAGFAAAQNNTTGAHVEVRVVHPFTGAVYGQCSATGIHAAFCGADAQVPPDVLHLRCVVEGYDHGWYSCGTDP